MALINGGALNAHPLNGASALEPTYTDVDLVGASASVFTPSVDGAVVVGLVGASGGVYAPSIDGVADAGLVGAGSSVFAPSLVELIYPPLVGAGPSVFAPVFELPPFPLVGSPSTAFAPSIESRINVGLFGVGSSVFTPSLSVRAPSVPGVNGSAHVRLAYGGQARGELLVGSVSSARYAKGGTSTGSI